MIRGTRTNKDRGDTEGFLILKLVLGFNVLKIVGCAGFVVRGLGTLFRVGLEKVRVLLPLKVSFCAFRSSKCLLSIC